MIEELQILREIFGDLSAVGIWAIVAYFTYKVLIIIAWLLALFGAYKVSEKLFLAAKAASTEATKDELRAQVMAHKEDAERAKHAYKLLSERMKKEAE